MNWKYILIVVVLAVIVGGGILAYQYWWLPKEEAKILETKPPEVKTPEEVPPEETPEDETANWETYSTPYYSIKYPNTWIATKDFNDPRLSYLDRIVITNKKIHPSALDFDGVDAISMAIEVSQPALNLNVEQFIQKGFSVQEMIISGYRAFKITEPDTQYPSAYFSFRASTDKCSINLEGNYSTTNQGEYLRIVEQMIGTIKIFEPDETTNWKTYRNEEYGFEVKYPKDYPIKEEAVTDRLAKTRILSPEITVEFEINGKIGKYTTNNIRIDINIYNNPNSLQLNQWLDGISETDSGPTFDAKYRKVISINGIKGVQWYSGCCGGCEEDIYIRGDKTIYNFALEGGTPGGSKLCEGDVCKECDICCFSVSGEMESIFNQILSTFRFLE